jgi:hypothetical protein
MFWNTKYKISLDAELTREHMRSTERMHKEGLTAQKEMQRIQITADKVVAEITAGRWPKDKKESK